MAFNGLFNLLTYFSPEAKHCPQQTESIAALVPSHLRTTNKTRTITMRWIRVFSRNILLICLVLHQEAERRQISGNKKASQLRASLGAVCSLQIGSVVTGYCKMCGCKCYLTYPAGCSHRGHWWAKCHCTFVVIFTSV